jgi:hypothetical protein
MCALLLGRAHAQTNGFTPISDSYSVQYPSNCTNVSERFTASNGVYTCWVYGDDSPAACCSGTGPRTEMRWQTWPNQTVANQFVFDEMFSAGTQNTCIHQIKSDNKGDGTGGGEAIYLQVNQPGTLRQSVGANFASGIAGTWFHINSLYDPVTGVGKLYYNGTLVYSTTSYGPYPNGDWYFKTGTYDNGMPTNAEAWVQIENVVHLVQTSGFFNLAPSPSLQSVTPGQTTNFTVTMTTNTDFSGTVTFGIAGLPANATASFVPPSLTAPGTSTLTITTTASTPGGSYALTIEGTNSTFTLGTNVTLDVVTGGVNPGTLLWTGASSVDTNWSTPGNWNNITAGGFGPPGLDNSVLFTNTATVSSPTATNNVLDESFGVQSLHYANNAPNTSPNYHVTFVSPGETLTVTNGLIVGTANDAGASQVVNAVLTGAGGTLLLTNGVLAVTQGSGTDGAHQAVLDLSGLGNLILTNVSRIAVAVYQTPAQVANGGQRSSGVLYLARTNVIAVTSTGVTNGILVGWNDSQGNGNSLGVPNAADDGSALYLGETNTIFTDAIYVGTDKTLGCLLAFDPNGLNNPVAFIRGISGPSSRVSLWGIGDTSMKSNSNQSASGTNDFTGGTVDALVANMTVGVSETGASSSDTGDGSGVLTFNAGTIDVNYLTNGWSVGTGTNGTDLGTGTVNVNGTATLNVNHVLALAENTGSGTGVPSGTLHINGGTVIASTIFAGTGTSVVSLSGGTLIVTNTAGSPGAAIGAFAATNSTLHLNLNGASVVTNIVVANLTASGLNTIAIDSAVNTSGPLTFPLVSYASFIGSVAANFTKGALPAGFSASLLNNSAQNRIDMVIAPSATVTPRISAFSLSGSAFNFSGSNGLPKGTYYVLTSTNASLPIAQWSPIATNSFDAGGNFSFSTAINPSQPGQFFLLEIP